MTSSAQTAAGVEVEGELPANEPSSQGTRLNLRLTSVAIASAVLVALYLGFVVNFSTNEPLGDEWTVVPLIHSALHGHLTLGGLWEQHLESRIVFPNILFVLSGFVNHYDIRSIILVSAVIYIISFFLLLRVYRAYDNRPLTVVPCVVLGLIWFSLADVKNALWGFQVAWFLVVCCFLIMLYALSVSRLKRSTVLLLALLAAVVGSFSAIQGFMLWPLGLFIVLWRTPWNRRTLVESGIWTLGCILTSAVYFIGYSFVLPYALCSAGARCHPSYLFGHPAQALAFSTQLLGAVFPTSSTASGAHEILGAVLAATAVFVVVQSFRERRVSSRPPVPAAIILFALLCDAMIVYGRFGFGQPQTPQYVMPQVVLLAGIASYFVPKILAVFRTPANGTRSHALRILCLCSFIPLALAVFGTTNFGLSQARDIQSNAIEQGRLVVNLSRIPPDERPCYESVLLTGGIISGSEVSRLDDPVFRDAREDLLSSFSSDTFKVFRADGPPDVPGCDKRGRG